MTGEQGSTGAGDQPERTVHAISRNVSSTWELGGHLRDRLDELAYLLFGRHVDSSRHAEDRARFSGLDFEIPFETLLIRQYVLSWVLALAVGGWAAVDLHAEIQSQWSHVPTPAFLASPPPNWWLVLVALTVGGAVGLGAKYLFGRLVSGTLGYLERRRRVRIEQTLPGAVRYLHVASAGTTDPRQLLERVAKRKRVHGATAETFETACKRQTLAGSMESAIRQVARDTPARDTLAPFLLTFIERRREGSPALREFLADESRVLAVEDERRHRQTGTYLRAVVGLFVLLLVGPVVLGLGLAGGLILFPGVAGPKSALQVPEVTETITAIGAGGILLLGAGAALFAFLLRPSGLRWAGPPPAQSLREALRTSTTNPTNALLVLLPIGIAILSGGIWAGMEYQTALLAAYVVVGVPAGLVDVRRARRRNRLDRALPKFVHSLAERLERGRPLRNAVAEIAREETYGSLDGPVRKLAADLQLIQDPSGGRKRALERFVGRIGTPFAGRTIGIAVGAIEAGAAAQSAVAHLQTETGRLVHADRARRSRFPVVLLVGWTVALLIVAIVIVVNLMVLETATPTGPIAGVAIEPLEGVTRERPLFYALTQATMLASGWFAGLTGRGVYEALLHSGVLLAITWTGFRLAGLG
ncbi:MAG: type II secretion system F family protein [Halodesulfurarchaeum sp.]|nr:type II secretion system F family protein [Halodesulfurarchaeum sp.]